MVQLIVICLFVLSMLTCHPFCSTSIHVSLSSHPFMSTILFSHPSSTASMLICFVLFLFELLAADVAWGNTHATLVLAFPCLWVVAGFSFCCCHFSDWLLVSGHAL